MSSKSLCAMLRAAVIAVAFCAVIICAVLLPSLIDEALLAYPEFAHWKTPWVIFLWLAALPCFMILALIWKISGTVRNETVFTLPTARLVKAGAQLMLADVAFFFTGNVLFIFLNMNHPSIFLLSLFVDVFGAALAVAAAVLARYITKAAALQEEADATV